MNKTAFLRQLADAVEELGGVVSLCTAARLMEEGHIIQSNETQDGEDEE